MNRISHVVFDLGEVIIRLDSTSTYSKFQKISTLDNELFEEKWANFTHFHTFEIGKIEENQFFNELKSYFGLSRNIHTLKEIWNSQLVAFIPAGLFAIDQAKKLNLNTAFLSNTNCTHQNAFDNMAVRFLKTPFLSDLVDNAFYSHLENERKPNRKIYEIVLEKLKIRPENMLFLDDRIENLEAAAALGIHIKHVTSDLSLYLHDKI